MELKKPNSMEECLYFTNRSLGEGYAEAWVYRPLCQKCKKGRMGKPIKKDGKPDKKSPVYECPQCGFQRPNEDVELELKVEVEYKCPHCSFEGIAATEYKRKNFVGVPSYVFECGKCGKKIGITKKLKSTKKKEGREDADV